jgi:hypothetical protein
MPWKKPSGNCSRRPRVVVVVVVAAAAARRNNEEKKASQPTNKGGGKLGHICSTTFCSFFFKRLWNSIQQSTNSIYSLFWK